MNPPLTLYFLSGPTASGKTAIAHRLAREMGWAILSADSMLFYRGMDIGTAKPSAEERQGITYYGIDLVEPTQTFSAGEYQNYCRQIWPELLASGMPVLVVGTGLYLKTLTTGLDCLPGANEEIRREAEVLFSQKGVSGLQNWLRQLDVQAYEKLGDKNNPRRLIRAIELAKYGKLITTTPPPDGGPPPPWQGGESTKKVIGLSWPRAMLVERISSRVHKMWTTGLVEEAKALRRDYGQLSSTASLAIGYREAWDYLDGCFSKEEAMAKTVTRTRQLAKRQMTWMRHQFDITWVEADQFFDEAALAQKVRTELI